MKMKFNGIFVDQVINSKNNELYAHFFSRVSDSKHDGRIIQ